MPYQFQSSIESHRSISKEQLQELKNSHFLLGLDYKVVHPDGSLVKFEVKAKQRIIKIPRINLITRKN